MDLTFPIDPIEPEPSKPRRGERPRPPSRSKPAPARRKASGRPPGGGGGDGDGPRPPKKAPPREEDHDLPRGVRFSLFAHGAFIILLLIKGLIFPGQPLILAPTLRVDMVGLPDILKKDLQSVSKTSPGLADALKKADAAAKEELERQKEAAVEEAKAKAAKQEEAEEADPDELVLQAKKKREADEKKARDEKERQEKLRESREDRAREKRLKNALARMKALSKLEAEASSEKSEKSTEPGDGVVIKGNRLSGGSSLDASAREGLESSYYERIRSRLVDNWALPVWLSRQRLQAQVLIFIDSRGRLRDFRFTKNSGNESFDEAVRRTLRESQPFPAPPSDLAGSIEGNGILVGFPL